MMNEAVDKKLQGNNNNSIMDDVIIVDTSWPLSSSTFLDPQSKQQEQQTILGSRMVSYAFKNHLHRQGNILVSIHHPSQSVIVTFCDGGGGSVTVEAGGGGGGLYRGSIPLEVFKPFLFDSIEDGEEGSVKITKDDTEIHQSLRTILIGQQPPSSYSSEQQQHQTESNPGSASNSDKISGLHLSIQLKQKENDSMEDQSTSTTPSFELILGRTNKAGIVQHLYKEVMKRCRIKDSSNNNNNNVENGVVPFCTMAGTALNDALRQIQELKSTIRMWQDNSKRLDNQRQNDRGRLFENFNKLRLDTIQNHKKEVLDLQTKHDDEIRTIKSSLPTIDATKTNKRRRDMLNFDNTNKDEEDKNDGNIRLPFNDTDGMLLKDGKATSTTRHQMARKRVLQAGEATDMTALYKEANDFAQSKKKTKNSTKNTTKQMTTKEPNKTQQKSSKYSSSSDSDTDVGETTVSAITKRRKNGGSGHTRQNKKTAAKRYEYDSTSSSSEGVSRQDVRSRSKTNMTEQRTARSRRSSRMYDSDSDTDVGEQDKVREKNNKKKTETMRSGRTINKSATSDGSSSDTDVGNNNNSEDRRGGSKPAPTEGNQKQHQQVNKKSNGNDGSSSDSSNNFKWED